VAKVYYILAYTRRRRMCLETRRAAEMSDATLHLAIAGACSNRSVCNKFNNYHCIVYIRHEDEFNAENAFSRIFVRKCHTWRNNICRLDLRCIVRVHIICQTNTIIYLLAHGWTVLILQKLVIYLWNYQQSPEESENSPWESYDFRFVLFVYNNIICRRYNCDY